MPGEDTQLASLKVPSTHGKVGKRKRRYTSACFLSNSSEFVARAAVAPCSFRGSEQSAFLNERF